MKVNPPEKMRFPKAHIVEALTQLGNRVYRFKNGNSNLPSHGWVEIDLSNNERERKMFLNVGSNGKAVALVHACPQLPADVRYVWQGRIYEPPMIPAACPRCRYRLDYVSKRG